MKRLSVIAILVLTVAVMAATHVQAAGYKPPRYGRTHILRTCSTKYPAGWGSGASCIRYIPVYRLPGYSWK